MPKVDSMYRMKKRKEILDAAARVLMRKTLYEINMTDIIKEAGISKGGIYLYYKDIDEVIIDLMDREFKASSFKARIDELLAEKSSVGDRLHDLLKLYAKYIKESSILACKMQFEIKIIFIQNRERGLKIRDRISIRETGENFIENIRDLIIKNFNENKISSIKEEEIVDYFQCFIEGVLEVFIFEKCYQFSTMNINLEKMMNILSSNIAQMMELK